MTDRIDLDWLTTERPAPIALSTERTARARAELFAHAAGAQSRPDPNPASARGPRRRSRGPARRVVLTAALATGAAAAAFAVTDGTRSVRRVVAPPARTTAATAATATTHARTHAGAGTRPVVAPPLTRLADLLLTSPTPVGDATLVIRHQQYPNSPEIDGADLYLDNGDYYYSPEPSGLPSLIQAHETVNTGASDSETRDIAAAQAAFTGTIEQARQRMSIANFDPGVKPRSVYPAGALAARLKLLREKKLKATPEPPASPEIQENGMIWDNSMDALLAGAGNPQVRAGVLHLLQTVPQVTVTQGTVDGQPALTLTASLWAPDDYQENLIVNADTGIPLKFIGANAGQPASVTVTYAISRVDAAAIEHGNFAPATPSTTTTPATTTPTTTPTTTS